MKSESKNINLMTDFGFKLVFGTEPNKHNLINFLNSFISPYFGPVTDIAYHPTEQLGIREKDKRMIFDVFCSNQKNDRIIVEMQQANQKFLKNRNIAYTSRIIDQSLERGNFTYDFPTVISIILVNHEIPELKGSNDYMLHVTLKDNLNNVFSKKNSLYYNRFD